MTVLADLRKLLDQRFLIHDGASWAEVEALEARIDDMVAVLFDIAEAAKEFVHVWGDHPWTQDDSFGNGLRALSAAVARLESQMPDLRLTRVLVPVGGYWQTGDVVKSSAYGVWYYMTLDRDGWRDSTPGEIRVYERAVRGDERVL